MEQLTDPTSSSRMKADKTGRCQGKEDFGAQAWKPHASTFDRWLSTRHDVEGETPTRIPTPRQYIKKDPNLDPVDEDSAFEPTPISSTQQKGIERLQVLLELQRRRNLARQSTCSVCSADITTSTKHQRIAHFNKCWRSGGGISSESESESESDSGESRKISQSIDSSEIKSLEDGNSNPNSGSDLDSYSTHDTKSTIRNGEMYTAARGDPTSCACCSRSVEELHPIDAFNHRRACLRISMSKGCPVCSVDMTSLIKYEDYELEDVLWHVKKCQQNREVSPIDREDFESLEARWRGRMHAVWRLFNRLSGKSPSGESDRTSRNHIRSFRSKQSRGREQHPGMYLLPATTLRRAETYDIHGEVKVTRAVQRKLGVWRDLEPFKRRAFSAYICPGDSQRLGGMKSRVLVDETWQEHRKKQSADISDMDTAERICSQESSRSTSKREEASSCEYTRSQAKERSNARPPPGFESHILESETGPSSAYVWGRSL